MKVLFHHTVNFPFPLVIVLCFLLFINIAAQSNPGAREIALSHSGIATQRNSFCIFNNPAGLSRSQTRELGLYYSPSPFGLKELANASAAYVEPFSFASFAVAFTTYGFNLYRENKIAFSASKSFYNYFYLGITAIYQTLTIKNYGRGNAINIILGGQVDLTDKLKLGFAIENLLRSSYGKEKNQIPVIYKTGLGYYLLKNLNLNISIEKELMFPVSVRGGIEYLPVKFIAIRAGVNNYPTSFSGGIGLNYSFLQVDYSFNENQNLGFSHQFGLSIRLNKF